MKARSRLKYSEMSEEELAEATREFDRPLATDEFRPLSRTERAQWRRAVRGRPKIGKGSKPVQITVERGLLEKADRLARRMGLSRSELIGSGLRVLLAAAARERKVA